MNNDLIKLFKFNANNFFTIIEDNLLSNYEFNDELKHAIDDNSSIQNVITNLETEISQINKFINDVIKYNLTDIQYDFINSKISSFNSYLTNLSKLESELKPNFNSYKKIILSNNQDVIDDLILINSNDSNIKNYVNNYSNDLKNLSVKLFKNYELFRNSNEKLKQILTFVNADPFKKAIHELDIQDQLVFADQDSEIEENIIKYFEFRFLISNLNEMTKIFYHTFVNSENFTTIENMNKYFKTWVRYNQYKSLISDEKNAILLQKYKGKKIENLKLELKELDESIISLTRGHVAKSS